MTKHTRSAKRQRPLGVPANQGWRPPTYRRGDQVEDEALAVAAQNGDQAALQTLCQRYYQQVYYYLVNESRIKETSFLEDIRQEVFLTVCRLIKQPGKFIPQGKGSFRAWFYTTAQNICRNCNYHRGKDAKTIYGKFLELIPAKPVVTPDEIAAKEARIKARLARILDKLSPQELKLMKLINYEGKTYEQIRQLPEFAKYSIDYLMLKVYNIRQKIQQAKKEE